MSRTDDVTGMPGWADRVEDLLDADERVEWEETLESTTFVVTTRRLLVFTPGGDGPNYRAVDRPNVNRVERTTTGDRSWLKRATTPAVLAGLGLAGSQVLVLDGMLAFDAQTSDRVPGVGAVLGAFDTLQWVVDNFNEGLLVVGVLSLVLALVLAGTYLATRTTVLRVSVAGDDDVTIRVPENVDGVTDLVERLNTTIRPDTPLDA